MDLSIRLVTPEIMRERGATAFDCGLTVDDHGMNENAPARKHWQAGWHQRRVECLRVRAQQAGQQPAGATPP